MNNLSTRHILFEKAPIKVYVTRANIVLEGFLNKDEEQSIFLPTNINLIVRKITKSEHEYELERFFHTGIRNNNLYTNLLSHIQRNSDYYLNYKHWYKVVDFEKKEDPDNEEFFIDSWIRKNHFNIKENK